MIASNPPPTSPPPGLRRYLHHQLRYAYLRLRHSPGRIRRFRDLHGGETIFCIGAGPSLAQEDLSLLDGEILFFVNRSFVLLDQVKPRASYWVVQDFKSLQKYAGVDRGRFSASFRTVHDYSFSLRKSPFRAGDVLLLPRITISRLGWPVIEGPGPHLSLDIADHIGMTPTVMFSAMQIAAYMGAARIALLGFDLDYQQGQAHFYPEAVQPNLAFFGSYESSLRPVLQHYHRVLNADGPRLVNCSKYTREDVLPRMSLREVLGR